MKFIILLNKYYDEKYSTQFDVEYLENFEMVLEKPIDTEIIMIL